MTKNTSLHHWIQEEVLDDLLTELLRQGDRQLIAQAVEVELELFLKSVSDKKFADGRLVVVRNGYLPGRAIQTGIGDVEIRVPKVRDRSKSSIKFNSSLLPRQWNVWKRTGMNYWHFMTFLQSTMYPINLLLHIIPNQEAIHLESNVEYKL